MTFDGWFVDHMGSPHNERAAWNAAIEEAARIARAEQVAHDIRCGPECKCADGHHIAAAIEREGWAGSRTICWRCNTVLTSSRGVRLQSGVWDSGLRIALREAGDPKPDDTDSIIYAWCETCYDADKKKCGMA